MKKTIIFTIIEPYADWEYAFLAAALQDRIGNSNSGYEVKTMSVTKKQVRSIGGFITIPDFSLDTIPQAFSGLVLVGGYSWRTEQAGCILPFVKTAYREGKIIGAICDATVFLGMNGLLNERKHTSNSMDELVKTAGEVYTGRDLYICKQAVRDGNLITANGTGYLEFTREYLYALGAYPDDYIEEYYRFYKKGSFTNYGGKQ